MTIIFPSLCSFGQLKGAAFVPGRLHRSSLLLQPKFLTRCGWDLGIFIPTLPADVAAPGRF